MNEDNNNLNKSNKMLDYIDGEDQDDNDLLGYECSSDYEEFYETCYGTISSNNDDLNVTHQGEKEQEQHQQQEKQLINNNTTDAYPLYTDCEYSTDYEYHIMAFAVSDR
eukprot:UN05338